MATYDINIQDIIHTQNKFIDDNMTAIADEHSTDNRRYLNLLQNIDGVARINTVLFYAYFAVLAIFVFFFLRKSFMLWPTKTLVILLLVLYPFFIAYFEGGAWRWGRFLFHLISGIPDS